MKKTSLLIAMLFVVIGVAQASTITQTLTVSDFVPGVDTTYNLLFNQFDTQGGTLTLSSVTISVTVNAWGGYYAVDNDGGTAASVTVAWGASGRISTGSYIYDLPSGSVQNTQYATLNSGTVSLTANTGDSVGVYNAGSESDKYRLDGSTVDAPTQATVSGTRTTSLDAYSGTGQLGLTYIGNQASTSSQVGGVYYSGGPASSSAIITITYEYVPEPTCLALVAIGCGVLGLRRGRHDRKV